MSKVLSSFWGGRNGKANKIISKTPEEKAEWDRIIQYSKLHRTRNWHGHKGNLTPPDIKEMLDEAGITIWDVGQRLGQYQLSRYFDQGNYDRGNCRFILKEKNLMERHTHGMLDWVKNDYIWRRQ
jgi:hypothetical protein